MRFEHARGIARIGQFANRIRHLGIRMARERPFHHEAARPCGRGSRVGGGFRPRGARAGGALLAPARHRTLPRGDRRRGFGGGGTAGAHRRPQRGLVRPQPAHPPARRAHLRSRRPRGAHAALDRQPARVELAAAGKAQAPFARDRQAPAAGAPRRRGRAVRRGHQARRPRRRLRPLAARAGRDRAARRADRVARRAARRAARAPPPLELSAVNLRLRNAGERHAIGLSARPPAELGATLELRAMLQGTELADPAAWKGRLYAELGYTDLAAWRTWIDYPWRIDQGQGALRAWLTFEAGEVRRATADLALSDVAARFDEALSPLRLASLRGRLQGSSDNGRYYVAARDLAIGIEDGTVVAPSDFDVTWTAGSSGGGTLAAAAIELEPLARLAASLPLPERVRTVLAEV